MVVLWGSFFVFLGFEGQKIERRVVVKADNK